MNSLSRNRARAPVRESCSDYDTLSHVLCTKQVLFNSTIQMA